MSTFSCVFEKAAFALTVIGAVNWGLVGVADFNLVHFLLSSIPMLQKGVYILVGISGLYLLMSSFKKMAVATNGSIVRNEDNNSSL